MKESIQSLKKSVSGNNALSTSCKELNSWNVNIGPKLTYVKPDKGQNGKVSFMDRRKKVQIPLTSRDKSNSKINTSARSNTGNNQHYSLTKNPNSLSGLVGNDTEKCGNVSSNLLSIKKQKELITLSAHKFNNVTINNTYNTNIKTNKNEGKDSLMLEEHEHVDSMDHISKNKKGINYMSESLNHNKLYRNIKNKDKTSVNNLSSLKINYNDHH